MKSADQRGEEKCNGRGGSAKATFLIATVTEGVGVERTRAYLNNKSDPKTEGSHALTSVGAICNVTNLDCEHLQIDYRERNELLTTVQLCMLQDIPYKKQRHSELLQGILRNEMVCSMNERADPAYSRGPFKKRCTDSRA
mmetsp:Transcript_33234/g.75198  ORF Transcript_33234/g.75198 Transcript_33234/m.75198 type:complete len:140 (-) Transcript_33234:23-442(-)